MAQEGSVKTNNILGIQRNSSYAVAQSGTCNEIIGLEYKDGVLVPFEPLKTLVDSTNWDNIWVHKTTHQNNYIYLQGRKLYWQKEEDALKGYEEFTFIDELEEGVTCIDFTGNILCYNKTVNLFKKKEDDTWDYVQMNLDDIKFKMQVGAQGNGFALMYDSAQIDKDIDTKSKFKEDFWETLSMGDRVNYNFQILEGAVKKGDYISGAVYLRYALKMYDGSYINISEPKLFCPDTYYEKEGINWKSGLKFDLDEICPAATSGFVENLKDPQIPFITPFFDSTLFWSWLNYTEIDTTGSSTDDKIKSKELEECIDLINEAIDGNTVDSRKYYLTSVTSTETNFVFPYYWYGKHKEYQRPSATYWNLPKGQVGFRERIQFNNQTFKKKKYYKYDKVSKKLIYDYDTVYDIDKADNIAPLFLKDIEVDPSQYAINDTYKYTYNSESGEPYYKDILNDRGWTWGVLQPCVFQAEDNKSLNRYSSGFAMAVFAMTAPVDAIGQNKFIEYIKDIYLHHNSSKNWTFSTFDKSAGRDFMQLRYDQVEGRTPSNEYIGEVGFMIANLTKFENDMSSTKGNCVMAFGRELYTPVYRIDEQFEIPEDYKDLITSVDIFMTTPISMHEEKYKSNSDPFSMQAHRPYKDKGELMEEVNAQLGMFHKIHSIPFEEIIKTKVGYTVMPYIKRGKIASVEQQPLLSDGGRSTYDYKVSWMYNNKLHIAQITENLLKGYESKIDSVELEKTFNYGQWLKVKGANNIAIELNSGVEADLSLFTQQDCVKMQQLYYSNYRKKVLDAFGLKTDYSDYKIYLCGDILVKIDNENKTVPYKQEINLFAPIKFTTIIYPDYRAEMLNIEAIEIDSELGSFSGYLDVNYSEQFEKYESANKALVQDLSGFDFIELENIAALVKANGLTSGSYQFNVDESGVKRNDNIFKVSTTYNPISFPYASTYNVGHGKIIGFSSTSVAMSQGQFGAYPLYVFTTEGIFTMKVDTTGIGSYLTNTPASREICVNANSIVQVDGGVYFASDKGLMFISGTETKLASAEINGEPEPLPNASDIVERGDGLKVYNNAITNVKLVELVGAISHEDFRKYIADQDTYISYVYIKQKLLIYNKNYAYCYLFDIVTNVCTKLAKRIKFDTKNYPSSLYAIIEEE